ncbi:MAG: hypothetical protein HY287_10110 [Planctomycetes bacterium]|nr:hypothetical protein [Planctomycetota bacterium]MBI3834669.1 hypothetical protein [Planctomycetota bacterium]
MPKSARRRSLHFQIRRLQIIGVAALISLGTACTGLLNPAFINSTSGGVYPVTPGPGAAFVLVRGRNETAQNVQFIVTIERQVLVTDDQGNFVYDQTTGLPVTRPERQTVKLDAGSTGKSTDVGTLFSCNPNPVTKVGLGANLLPTDAVVFVGGQGSAGALGFGVTAPNLNPLDLYQGNFNCGDTVIFRAFSSKGVAGGVAVDAFLLPGSEQPSIFAGLNTFVNYQSFLESQVPNTEGP